MLGIIINPKSGKRAFRRQRLYLFRLLKQRHEPFHYRVTKYASHATELARELVEKDCDQILVLGGDGTLSEVVNGIMTARVPEEKRRQIAVGLMPRGTGNDWGRYWNIDRRNFEQALDRFFNGENHPLDIGCLTYWRNGEEQYRYFINSIGFGIDSLCCYFAEHLKYYVGSHAINYFFGLLLALRYNVTKLMTVSADGEVVAKGELFTMNIANGPYAGGGIKQSPNADPTDGVFDAVFITPPTFREVLHAIPRLYNGELNSMSFVHPFRGKTIEIDCRKHLMIEADGILHHFMAPCRVECIHHALQFRV